MLELDKHNEELRVGVAHRAFQVQGLEDKLHIHPTHLNKTLYQVLGQPPRALYENKLSEV